MVISAIPATFHGAPKPAYLDSRLLMTLHTLPAHVAAPGTDQTCIQASMLQIQPEACHIGCFRDSRPDTRGRQMQSFLTQVS